MKNCLMCGDIDNDKYTHCPYCGGELSFGYNGKPGEYTFDHICTGVAGLEMKVWRAVSGLWYANICFPEMDEDVKYLANGCTPQEAVEASIRYVVNDYD